jgi:hypothetical protein
MVIKILKFIVMKSLETTTNNFLNFSHLIVDILIILLFKFVVISLLQIIVRKLLPIT